MNQLKKVELVVKSLEIIIDLVKKLVKKNNSKHFHRCDY